MLTCGRLEGEVDCISLGGGRLGASQEGLNSEARGFGMGVQTKVGTGGLVHP